MSIANTSRLTLGFLVALLAVSTVSSAKATECLICDVAEEGEGSFPWDPHDVPDIGGGESEADDEGGYDGRRYERTWLARPGHYFHRDPVSRRWSETINGQVAFSFGQVRNVPGFVELYDGSRDVYVRLHSGASYVRTGQSAYVPLLPGSFDYNDAWEYWHDGKLGLFSLGNAGTWVERFPDGRGGYVTFNFRETQRDSGWIYLYDASRHVSVALGSNAMYLSAPNFAWNWFRAGSWTDL